MGIAQRITARLPRQPWIRPSAEVWETEHRLFHALGSVRAPVAVQWMVTRSCDLHCGHCYAEAGRRAPGELTTEEAKRLIIDACADMGCPLLVLAGGELWLRRDIEELIEYAVGRGLEWAMHTHGGHIPKHRELLRRHPPSLAAISLDGDREHHDRFRGKEGCHAAVLAAVRELVETGCDEVVLGTTVTRGNADQIADMYPEVRASGAHSWGLHLVAPEGRADLERVPTAPQLRRIAAFARSRRSLFPVELCNEWGSAGKDDAYYRDRPFACGAGRISMVVDPTGEVMPCTTTDPRESEGNVRDRPLRSIWTHGFGRFRDGGDPITSDATECWLQTRNGVRIAEAAFGAVAQPRPTLIDLIPPPLISLSHRLMARRRGDDFASATSRRVIAAAAVGLAFVSACTLRRDTPEEPVDGASATRPAAESSNAGSAQAAGQGAAVPPEVEGDAAGESVPLPSVSIASEWPESLSGAGLRSYGVWADMRGLWKSTILPSVLEWEQEGTPPSIDATYLGGEIEQELLDAWVRALKLHVHRDQGEVSLADLIAILDASEAVSLFDAAFAAHLWRVAERVGSGPADIKALEQRARLYARLLRHQHIVQVLVVATATVGPITQRAWLKKSGPPPGWTGLQIPLGFESTARAGFRAGVEGPWDSVGMMAKFVPSGASVVRYASGAMTRVGRAGVRWGRLDVFYTESATRVILLPNGPGDASTESSEIVVDLPAGTVLTHASLARRLPQEALTSIDAQITQALAGQEPALARVELLLPIAHARVSARLAESSGDPGAPALRTVLVAYAE